MAMSANWAEKACILAILLALFCAGCGKYDALERNMQYVSIEMLRKESVVAYERLGTAHAAWQASPRPDTLENFKNFYLQYSIIYNELMDRATSRPGRHLPAFASIMPPPPPGTDFEPSAPAVPATTAPAVETTPAGRNLEETDETSAATPTGGPVTVAASAEPAGDYVVQSGDTPHLIAKRLHVSEARLLEANGITAPDKLAVGKSLAVPKE